MFDHCLYFNTTALARQLEREWAAVFLPLQLTSPQAFLLRAILDHPGLAPRELADSLVIARATATRALDSLAAKGLIERRASDSDGREHFIHPTQGALSIHSALNEASGRVTRRLKMRLGATTFQRAVGTVREVRFALG